jgi:hypothetical protein
MNKVLAIILVILILTVCGISIAYGANPDFRASVNDFLFGFLGPSIYGALSGIATVIAANSWYQLLHPILWMVAGGLVVGIVWKALQPHMPERLGGPKASTAGKTITMQREPAEPETAPKTVEVIEKSQEKTE